MSNPPTKKCDECNRWKQRHLWYSRQWQKKSGGEKKGSALCKSCYVKTPSYAASRDATYRRKYGITLAEYGILLEAQNGRCYICGKKPFGQRLAVDHHHGVEDLRNSIRGLLCRVCNEYIGHIGDSQSCANRLFLYLAPDRRPAQALLP